MKRDFLEITDLSGKELAALLELAAELKTARAANREERRLTGKSLAMIFEKPSTRTRISFEIAMFEQGGHALNLTPNDLQLGRGETIEDTARVISRFCSAIMMRTHEHERLERLAKGATVPVINGLSDYNHPCQILADLLTVKEIFGDVDGVKVAYVGDGNNVATSWIMATTRLDFELRLACPEGYEPAADVLKRAAGSGGPGKVSVLRDPTEAVAGAQVVYTDVWTSMGQESEGQRRLAAFEGYQISARLLEGAAPGVRVLHCLPAHWGEEIEEGLSADPRLAIFDQAENRLHAQKALLITLLNS